VAGGGGGLGLGLGLDKWAILAFWEAPLKKLLWPTFT
jgi:hypothetical protein